MDIVTYALAKKLVKEAAIGEENNKVLSDENFTTSLKEKLDSIEIATSEEVTAMLDEILTV